MFLFDFNRRLREKEQEKRPEDTMSRIKFGIIWLLVLIVLMIIFFGVRG